MGEKLVERRPDGYLLTPAGEDALEAATEMDAGAQALERQLLSTKEAVRGLVRINAPPALTQGFLAARLATLVETHAAIDLDLATDLRAVSLERRKADIAVRIGQPQDSDMIAKPLGTLAYGFYGTTAQRDAALRGESLTFVGFNEANADMPEADWLARQFPRARVAFRAENQLLQAVAARAGAGLALLPHYLGRQIPDLHPCELGPVPPSREIWLLIRRQDRGSAPIRAVMQHIVDVFEKERALFSE
jgi:DNA-binding transcriptional LysR family regulator